MSQHLGEFEQLVLFAVLRLADDAYGVRIRQEIEARTGRPVSAGAIYTTLGRLESRSYVESKIGTSSPARGGRRRKYYRLLADGATALQRAYGHVQEMADGILDDLAMQAKSGDQE
jgi:DNA-binding PadR family transcriptional regulator